MYADETPHAAMLQKYTLGDHHLPRDVDRDRSSIDTRPLCYVSLVILMV